MFFARQPSARAEALGKSGVALSEGDITARFYNPARLVNTKGISFGGAYSTPYYSLDKAYYNYFAASCRLGDYGVLGFSRYYFNYNAEITYEGNPIYENFIPYSSNYTLSYAFECVKNISLGINTNIYQNELIPDDKGSAYSLDIGVLKNFQYDNMKNMENFEQKIILGSSLFNIIHSKLKYPNEAQQEELPIEFRLGISYKISLNKKFINSNLQIISLLIHTEYQDLFNSEYHTAFKIGSEISFFEILSLRVGYYNESKNDYGHPEINGDNITDNTYGFGIQLPLNKFTQRNLPITIKFDSTILEQPSHSIINRNYDDFELYTINIHWEF